MIGVCGEALIDFTSITGSGEIAYTPRPGGSPFNVAIGLARLGVHASFISKLSDDQFGEMLHDHLKQNNVDLRWTVRGSEPTALAFVIPAPGGTHEFAFYGSDTAEQSLANTEIPKSIPDEVNALHFGSYSMVLGQSARTYEDLMRRERSLRVISLDPNVRPALFPDRVKYRGRIEQLLRFATLVKASADDLAWLYPGESTSDIAKRWLDWGPMLVVVTHGADGAIGMTGKTTVNSPGVPVNAIDTVGAGDAFMSAMLARLDDRELLNIEGLSSLSTVELEDVLTYANKAAAISCTLRGADPPTHRRIETFDIPFGH